MSMTSSALPLIAAVTPAGERAKRRQPRTKQRSVGDTIIKHFDGSVFGCDRIVEAILTLSQSGVAQLIANATLVGKVLKLLQERTHPIAHTLFPSHIAPLLVGRTLFPSHIAPLLVGREAKKDEILSYRQTGATPTTPLYRLLSRDDVSKKMRDNDGYDFSKYWKQFETKVEGLQDFKCNDSDTMIRYITNFHTTIEWYMDCGFFSDSFTVKKTMKDGELDKYYFSVNKKKAEGQFSVMEKDLRLYLGDTPLRDLNGTKANLIWRLNHGYALSISEKGSINQGVLVLGMSNFLSNYVVKQIEAMTKHLNPITGQTPLKVYTVGSKRSIVDQQNISPFLLFTLVPIVS